MEEDEGVESGVLSSMGQQPPHFRGQRLSFGLFRHLGDSLTILAMGI